MIKLFLFVTSVLCLSCKEVVNNVDEHKTNTMPVAITDSAANISSKSAILYGSINPNGLRTNYYFEYGTTEGYDLSSTSQIIDSVNTSVSVHSEVLGLQADKIYYFRLVATNNSGVSRGKEKNFNTGLPAPSISINTVSNLIDTSVRLSGTINPNGYTTYFFFEYGLSTAYGLSTPVDSMNASTTSVNISSLINPLLSGTAYHWRLVAKNKGGTYYGPDSTFTTLVDYFPLFIGKWWNYSYYRYYYYPQDPSYTENGTKFWQIISSTQKNDTTEYICRVLTNTTFISWTYKDTTNIKDSVTYFSIKQVNDFIIMSKFSFFYYSEIKFNRYYASATPVQIGPSGSTFFGPIILTRAKGMTSFDIYYFGMHNWEETFSLSDKNLNRFIK